MALHQDFKDLLEAFATERVRYLLIGGYAVAFHSRPRFTKDIDLWIDPSLDNVAGTSRALQVFGDFSQAYARREATEWDGVPVSVIGLDDLVASKRAAGRPQDLLDIKMLERSRRR